MPMNDHLKSRSARNYSVAVCFLSATLSTAPPTTVRLRTTMAESRMCDFDKQRLRNS
jgi:hypothetical protein